MIGTLVHQDSLISEKKFDTVPSDLCRPNYNPKTMKSQFFGKFCALLVVSLPLPAFAETMPSIPGGFDYKSGPLEYQLLPDMELPNRTLPKAFDFPILTEVGTDTTITTNSPITDGFVSRLTTIPSGITLDDIPRLRAEYTRSVDTWAEEIKECLAKKPRLVRVSTSNPIQFYGGTVGTIVLNANNRAVCQ